MFQKESEIPQILMEMQEFEIAALSLIKNYIEEETKIHELSIYNSRFNQNKTNEFLKKSLSQTGAGLAETVKLFFENIAPTLIRNHHPRFLNWVVGGRTTASVLGDFYTTIFDQLVMLYGHGTATQIEDQTIRWLLELFNLSPEHFCGLLTTGATEANLCALAAARQWYGETQGSDISANGLYNILPPTIISGLPHSSLDKSMQILGLGRTKLIKIYNTEYKIELVLLEQLLQKHRNAIVIANCGEVNTGQSDNLKAISDLCSRHHAWLHVDAAFGLFARCYSKTQELTEGIEFADSITCDAHKLGNVPYGCGFLFINKKNHTYLRKSFSATAPYLSENSDHPMNTRVANSARFLALPLWFSLLTYGKEGYQDMVKRQCEFAAEMGEWLTKQENYELLNPVVFNIVLFRHKDVRIPADNQRLIACINSTNKLSLSGTTFNGTPALRLAFANWRINLAQDKDPVCEGLLEGAVLYKKNKIA